MFKGCWKRASESAKLISVVIGMIRASRQYLSNLVGKVSREQVESLQARIAFLTSSGVAGEKL